MEPNKTPEREETSEPLEPITTASFQRKAVSIAELPDSAAFTARERFVVVKVIELTADQYRYFTDHLMDDTLPFIKENTRLTGCDRDGRTKALMITTPGRNGCLLVNTEGYDYARYAAYASEKGRIDTRGIPVERMEQKARDAGGKAPAHSVRSPGPGR